MRTAHGATLLLGVILASASCGAGSSQSDAGDTLPFGDQPATTATTAPTTSTSSTSDPSAGAATLVITPEVLSGLLSTEQGRVLVVQGLADQAEIDFASAECFVNDIDVETLAALSSLQTPGNELSLSDEQGQDLLQAVTLCEIDQTALIPDGS